MKHTRWHYFVYRVLYFVVGPFLRLALNFKREVVRKLPGPAIVISNHTTNLDPALVGMSFPHHMYFVASEHVLRWGFASRVIQFLFSPIVRVKGKTDTRVGRVVLRQLKSGHCVCLFAEGNRSYNGLSRRIFPATGKLVKASGATLVTYRNVGGYFAAPRWGAKMRKGPMRGAPVNVYPPEVLRGMTADEINAAIQRDIDEDAYARQLADPQPYTGKRLAEDIQTALYLCPGCGGIGTLTSQGGGFACGCGLHGTYDKYGMLSGEGFEFTTVRDWYAWQTEALPRFLSDAGEGPICFDEAQELCAVDPAVSTTPLATGRLAIYRDRLECAGHSFALAEIADLAIIGQSNLLFATTGGKMYEIKSVAPRSADKYQRIFEALAGVEM